MPNTRSTNLSYYHCLPRYYTVHLLHKTSDIITVYLDDDVALAPTKTHPAEIRFQYIQKGWGTRSRTPIAMVQPLKLILGFRKIEKVPFFWCQCKRSVATAFVTNLRSDSDSS